MISGRIIKGIGGFYYVRADRGLYECKARGIFRKEDIVPLPGDNVVLNILDEEKKLGNIDSILPRQSLLVRPAIANVTQVVVVISVKSPVTDFMLLDKLLITAEQKGLNAIICLNKADLSENGEADKITRDYCNTGYKTISMSSFLGVGFDELDLCLKDNITVFSGQSGVGKSTILNVLMNSYLMKTGDVSEKIERGKHTTRHAELVGLKCGGYVADTPGFSTFELAGLGSEELELYYPEFKEYLGSCKFRGCSHISEPDCRVKDALNKGLVNQGRYDRYVEIYNTLKANPQYATGGNKSSKGSKHNLKNRL